MKNCRVCKEKPAAPNRLMCRTCSNIRTRSNKKVLQKASLVKDDSIVEREKHPSGYSKKEFWIETPHAIKRKWMNPDNFNEWY
jgi:hypothetical protein